jgi:hypothetical protein
LDASSDDTILMVHTLVHNVQGGPQTSTDVAVLEASDAEGTPATLSTRKLPPTSKAKDSNKKRKARALAKLVERVTVASSNEEETPRNYEHRKPLPDRGTTWTLPQHDYWEPQSRANARFKAKAPEASHLLSQKEVLAKHGGAKWALMVPSSRTQIALWSFSFSCSWMIRLLKRGLASMVLKQLVTLVASCDVQFLPCGGALSVPLFVPDLWESIKLFNWRAEKVMGVEHLASYQFPRSIILVLL